MGRDEQKIVFGVQKLTPSRCCDEWFNGLLCSVSSHRPLLAELQPSVKSSCARLSPPVLSLSQVACRVVDTLNLFQGPSEGSPWVARPGDPNRSRSLQR